MKEGGPKVFRKYVGGGCKRQAASKESSFVSSFVRRLLFLLADDVTAVLENYASFQPYHPRSYVRRRSLASGRRRRSIRRRLLNIFTYFAYESTAAAAAAGDSGSRWREEEVVEYVCHPNYSDDISLILSFLSVEENKAKFDNEIRGMKLFSFPSASKDFWPLSPLRGESWFRTARG